MENKKSTFIKGAVILIIANLLVKLIGAAFKIPLTWLIGDYGMGLFNSAYTLYALLFTIATSGFPIAISKMVAESLAKGQEREARRVFTISLFVLGILGALGAAFLYFGAHVIASWMQNTDIAVGIMAIAPAVFFVAISCAFRGYFQGKQNMLPTGLSNIMEALGKLVIGYIAAFFMLRWGIEMAAAGAIYGVAFGTALSSLLLFILFLWEKRGRILPKATAPLRSWGSLAKQLLIIAIPITLGAAVQSITQVIDSFSVVARLQIIPWIDSTMATTMYGAYVTKAVTLFGLPLALVVALSTSVVPNIASNLAEGDEGAAKRVISLLFRITTIIAIPCAVGMWALAMPIIQTLYGTNVPDYSARLLEIISVSAVFASLLSVSSAVLQSYGKMHLPVIFMVIGGIVKLSINWFFIPRWGIVAAPISTDVCYFVIIALNLTAVAFVAKIRYDIMGTLIKPLIASAALAVVAFVTYNAVFHILGLRISCLFAIVLAAIVYFAVMFLIRGITKDDIPRRRKA